MQVPCWPRAAAFGHGAERVQPAKSRYIQPRNRSKASALYCVESRKEPFVFPIPEENLRAVFQEPPTTDEQT